MDLEEYFDDNGQFNRYWYDLHETCDMVAKSNKTFDCLYKEALDTMATDSSEIGIAFMNKMQDAEEQRLVSKLEAKLLWEVYEEQIYYL